MATWGLALAVWIAPGPAAASAEFYGSSGAFLVAGSSGSTASLLRLAGRHDEGSDPELAALSANPVDSRARRSIRKLLKRWSERSRTAILDAAMTHGNHDATGNPTEALARSILDNRPAAERDKIAGQLLKRTESGKFRDPQDLYYARAVLATWRGTRSEAAEEFMKASALNGRAGPATAMLQSSEISRQQDFQRLRQAEIVLQDGDYAKARTLLAGSGSSAHGDFAVRRAELLRRIDDGERTRNHRIKRIETARALDMGITEYNLRNYDKARGFLTRVLDVEPNEARARKLIAEIDGLVHQQKDPAQAETHYQRGLAFFASGQHEAAAREWEVALRMQPDADKFRSALSKVRGMRASARGARPR